MTTTSVILHGTVTAEGALKLDEKIPLPAGRVQITVEPVAQSQAAQKDWWQFLQEGRTALEERGTRFRTHGEIDAEREAFRSENGAAPSGE